MAISRATRADYHILKGLTCLISQRGEDKEKRSKSLQKARVARLESTLQKSFKKQ